MADETKRPEGIIAERKLHPASIPGVMELDEDGDLSFYISPSLLRLRALHERASRPDEEAQ